MTQPRAGSKITIDGHDGKVHKKSGARIFVSWFSGKPFTRPDGSILGWSASDTHYEWIAIDSPRVNRVA